MNLFQLASATLIIGLAAFFSCFTLWLIDSWIKYPLFVLEILALITLHLVITNHDFEINVLDTERISNLRFDISVDIALIASVIILVIFRISCYQGSVPQVLLSLLVTSVLPGFPLQNIFGLTRYFSRLEKVVFSYILSYAFAGFMSLLLLLTNENLKTGFTLGSYVLLGLISAIKHFRQKKLQVVRPLTRNIDILSLVIVLSFYAVSFFLMYPGFALLPGTDISQHFESSVVLNRTPDLYIGSAYLLAHLHESVLIVLSNSSFVPVQMVLLSLNLLLPVTFYVMAKAHLKEIDARLPIIATFFWALFTNSYGGFSWLYFMYLKITSVGQTPLQLLGAVADKTYNGTIYGVFGLWYVPATISFIVLMATIFLLRKTEIPMPKYLALFSISVAAMYLTHVAEGLVLVTFLATYGLISKNSSIKINCALKASLVGIAFVALVYFFFSQITVRFVFDTNLLVSIILPALLVTLSLLVRNFRLKWMFVRSSRTCAQARHVLSSRNLAILLMFAYTVALMSWFSLSGSFHTQQVDSIGIVPWFIYPFMLGITGLLSILALYLIAENASFYRSLRFFIAFVIFAFVAGTIVSVLNLNFFYVDYWEKRFIWFIKIPLAMLAPIPFLLLVDKLRTNTHANFKAVALCVITGTIVLYGISTTFLNVEYWNIETSSPANLLSSAEFEAVTAFRQILDHDPQAWVATISDASASAVTFAAPPDTLMLRQLLYTAHTPEMALTQLYRHSAYSHPYLYISSRDSKILEMYSDRLVSKYISSLPVAFGNSEVTIYNVSSLSFPQPSSDNVLVVPADRTIPRENLQLAYYMLSRSFCNYTVAYDLDRNSLNFHTVILPFDPPEANTFSHAFQDTFNQTFSSWTFVKGDWLIEDAHLVSRGSTGLGKGIILSPIAAENFTVTVKLKPVSGNTAVANYASFVYSWSDSDNYRIADVCFNTDGYIYLIFKNIQNGVETDYPRWPGTRTSLKWSLDDSFLAKLTVIGESNELSVNGDSFLTLNLENVPGQIGLSSFRFSTVHFDDFYADSQTRINSRPIQDYIGFLNRGGRIVLLNTDGEGFFAKHLFTISNSTLSVQEIDGIAAKIDLPYLLSARLLVPEDNNHVISRYVSSQNEIPFILEKDYDNGGKLFYVNVYPIIQAIETSSNKSAFYPLIGELLHDISIDKAKPSTPLSVFDGYVRQICIKNNARIETESLLFPSKLDLRQVLVKTENSTFVFGNATQIELSDYSQLAIEPLNATIQNGNGFYTELQLNSTFSIRPLTNSMKVRITAGNKTNDLGNVHFLSITGRRNIRLQIKTPTISTSEVTFTEFYLQNSDQMTSQISGTNIEANDSKFSIMISDNYQAIGNLTLGRVLQNSSQRNQYDFLSTLPTAVFWALLLIPVFASILLVSTLARSTSNKRNALDGIDDVES